jgi:hypothetical protein
MTAVSDPTPAFSPPALPATALSLPIGARDVERIASEGFPLWEPVEELALRNRRITVAYGDLSQRLGALLGAGGPPEANWCTYGTWSSRTIGEFIDRLRPAEAAASGREPPGPLPAPGTSLGPRTSEQSRHEPLAAKALSWAVSTSELAGPARWASDAVRRSNGACVRSLAAGNRIVFLEIGTAVALFLRAYGSIDHDSTDEEREVHWGRFWDDVQASLSHLKRLDPSWMLTPSPADDDLRAGLRQYELALYERDAHLRSQLVVAGSLLIGAYEQRRVDGYVWTALALFTERAMRGLVRDRTGAMRGARRTFSRVYAGTVTRSFMTFATPDERLWVGRPIPPAPGPPEAARTAPFPGSIEKVTLPLLQALVTRYELAVADPRAGARNWSSFDERMCFIGTLFLQRHRHPTLFEDPFDAAETAELLAGRLPGGGGVPVTGSPDPDVAAAGSG